METIRSKNNPLVKDCQKLEQKKHRDQTGRFLIEGENAVSEALESGVAIHNLIFREGKVFPEDSVIGKAFRDAEAGAAIPGVDSCCCFSEELFRSAAKTVTSQGIMAVCRKPERELSELAGLAEEGGSFLVLDRLQDPGNIGTMIRTAEAAGYRAVILLKGTGDVFSPKIVRSAAGSLFRMPVLRMEDGPSMLETMRALGKKTVATVVRGGISYRETAMDRDIALIIGNEGNGCDEWLIRNADCCVTIPMKGKIESLNAAISAGIFMFENRA